MSYCVYHLFNSQNELIYIGRSSKPRTRQLAFETKYKITTHIGWCRRFVTFEQACAAELKAIAKYWPPYNKHLVSSKGAKGKQNFLGGKHTPEVKAKISAAGRGRVQSEETIRKRFETKTRLGITNKGRKQSSVEIARRSAALTGHGVSEQSRRNMSVAQLKRKRSEQERKRFAALCHNRLGKKHTAATRLKMSIAAKARET